MTIDDFESEEEYVSQMNKGVLLNPRIDTTFKALFTQPTKESRKALVSFLEAATERKIVECKLAPNSAPDMFFEQRGVCYDILCVFDDGFSANIEMQAFNQSYDYGKRAEYQVARLETTYLEKGASWEKAPTVFQISVLDFIYNKDKRDANKVVNRYAMRTKDGTELSNALNIIFIELPKVVNLEGSLETNTSLENWALFLKDVDNPQKADLIEKLSDKEDGLMQAQQSLSSISADQALWIAQYRQEIAERDRISSIEANKKIAREEGFNKGFEEGLSEGRATGLAEGRATGLAEGRATGLAEGRAMGFAEAKTELARVLKQANVELSLIAKSTGLSIEEIERL